MSAHSLFHNLQYFTNKRMSEGALRNTHLEITQVRNSLTTIMKTRARACSELIRWAEGLDDPAVLQLITSLGELEVKTNAASTVYVNKYREFCEVFRDILLERQELNNLRKEAKRAKAVLEKCTVKVRQLEMKMTNVPSTAADSRRKQLDAARRELAEAQASDVATAEKVAGKALEVQQQLHMRLRTAYNLLSTSSMDYLHACADVQEEMLRTISIFPTVRGRDDTGRWLYTGFAEDAGRTDPIWHHGERFAQLLDLQREGVTQQLDREGKQRKSMVDELTRDLREKERMITAELQQAKGIVQSLSQQLATMRREHVTSALLHAQVGIHDAASIEEEGFSEYIMRHGSMAMRAVDDLVAALSVEITDEVDFVAKSAALSMTLNATLLTAVGFARFCQAENSFDLVPLTSKVAAASRAFIEYAVLRAPAVALFPPVDFESAFVKSGLVPSLNRLADISAATQVSLDRIAAGLEEKGNKGKEKVKEKKKKKPSQASAPSSPKSNRSSMLPSRPAPQPPRASSDAVLVSSRPAPPPPEAVKMRSKSGPHLSALPSSPMYLPGMTEGIPRTDSVASAVMLDLIGETSLDGRPPSMFGFPAPPAEWISGTGSPDTITPPTAPPPTGLPPAGPVPTSAASKATEAKAAEFKAAAAAAVSLGAGYGGGGAAVAGGSNGGQPRIIAHGGVELVTSAGALKMALRELLDLVRTVSSRDSELRGAARVVAGEIEKKAYTAQQMLADSIARLEKLKQASTETGRLQETNFGVLDTTMALLRTVVQLITNAQQMQVDLSRREGGSRLTADEFNAKHKKWIEKFSETAGDVIEAAPMLVEAAIQVVTQRVKHEELDVAAHAITGSTARLVADSRTKALPPGCSSGEALVSSGGKVMTASQAVLAAVRESHNLKLASVLLEDFGSLTEHQAKRLMLSTQVEVLKLDAQLQREREKLGRLRTMFASEEKEQRQSVRS